MTRWQLRSVVLAAALLITAAIVASQTPPDLPPSVSADQWMALSDKAGMEITSRGGRNKGKPTEARVQIWVKVDGSWTPALLEQPHNLVPAS